MSRFSIHSSRGIPTDAYDSNNMHAAAIDEFGGPEVFKLHRLPVPAPALKGSQVTEICVVILVGARIKRAPVAFELYAREAKRAILLTVSKESIFYIFFRVHLHEIGEQSRL